MGQAVDTGHPKAREFLRRDLAVIESFFRRKGLSGCLDVAVAERFVVEYHGPSSSDVAEGASQNHAGEERIPLAGVEVVLQVRGRADFIFFLTRARF